MYFLTEAGPKQYTRDLKAVNDLWFFVFPSSSSSISYLVDTLLPTVTTMHGCLTS